MCNLLLRLTAAVALAACGACSLFGGPAPGSPSARCADLARLPLGDARIESTEAVSGGRHFSLLTTFIGVPWFDLPPTCRVTGTIKPSADSDIRFALWMPQTGWNGRMQGVGNGGFAGAVDTMSLKLIVQGGSAAVATDTGHEASDLDGSWALGHPEKLKDFGYRGIHETAQTAKQIIAAYYGRGPEHSYFSSASNGGRQALMEARRFPEDYDGIIAGAPAADGSGLMASTSWIEQRLNQNQSGYLPPAKLPAIAAATVHACDALDGVADGVIDDPRSCHFQPETLLCQGPETRACLTTPQVQTLKDIYSGPGGGVNDHRHGYEPGGEIDTFGDWKRYLLGSARNKSVLYGYALEFPRYLIYGDPNWTLDRLHDLDQFQRDAQQALGTVYSANDPDLSAFQARGGKLVVFQGWRDPAIPPQMTVDYYEDVRARLGADQTAQFVRLYMVPGMQHGFGGPGPNSFGQYFAPAGAEPHSNLVAALEAWVENGTAPQDIIAAKYDLNPLKAVVAPDPAKLVRTRPLCPYPQVARWTGQGSTDQAQNFRCVELPGS
jgi:tannase/feruloyl esterase